ncbi:MAG TPA: hypothetical protein VJA21_23815 [Verrucomicrobiae bacterium]
MNLAQITSMHSLQVIAKTSLLCAALGLLTAGCASKTPPATRGKPVPWTVKFVKNTPDSVEVDIFGVNKLEDDYWRNKVRMDDYCKPNSDQRQRVAGTAVRYSFYGNEGHVLEATDPKWKTWLDGACYELAIMAVMPAESPNPAADLRRAFLLLGKKEWPAKTIEVEIVRDGLKIKTPPRP